MARSMIFRAAKALFVCLSVSTGLSLGVVAQAQNYPTKLIRLIVPWPAGGGVDTSARIIAQPLSERMVTRC